jgi:hypothetical protein
MNNNSKNRKFDSNMVDRELMSKGVEKLIRSRRMIAGG